MEIVIKGTHGQVATFFKELCSGGNSSEILIRLAEAGILSTLEERDDDAIYQVFEGVGWETFQLAHLLFLHGKDDAKGRFLTLEQLEAIPLGNSNALLERSISARVGGAKKVCKRLGLKDFILDIKMMPKGEKRYYLSSDAISTFEQFLADVNEDYKEWLEEMKYQYPK
ncbi:hypothetical protein DSOUD_0467 [Desulfuromonas soudanensis]|uniref:Uncharacterized protein n=1 Tax=Desulfuromonas soudanensis TaxID=1603606 RepID=A0A0M3QEX8_9BACT|nr:hypothetical protein [Desulfuromonas soudanensis]ALC15259.1 hypothetical protein DSOUD_0467 [Desulfuromonas soudanensis]